MRNDTYKDKCTFIFERIIYRYRESILLPKFSVSRDPNADSRLFKNGKMHSSLKSGGAHVAVNKGGAGACG